jgi:hypothetical protein
VSARDITVKKSRQDNKKPSIIAVVSYRSGKIVEEEARLIINHHVGVVSKKVVASQLGLTIILNKRKVSFLSAH